MSTPTNILRAAANLLDRPGAWTQGTDARDATETSCEPRADDAVSWCAAGAIMRVAEDGDGVYVDARARLRETLVRAEHECLIGLWNDKRGRTQSQVVAMLRRAAEEEA